MKRRQLMQHLLSHGCQIVREGGRHTWVLNLAGGQRSFVPRHRDIKPHMVREICKQLGIPPPSER